MKKKARNEQPTTAINFAYTLTKKGEVIDQSTIEVEISQEEIEYVAENMRKNGGYPVKMYALENICEKIYNILYIDVLTEMFPDEEFLDDYMFELEETMPDELVALADELVEFKDVDQVFYLKVNDMDENKQMIRLQISNKAFHKMREIAINAKGDKNDFDCLKNNAPEIYSEVTDLVLEYVYKYSMCEYGESKACVLREFPYQVYESL